MFINTSPPSSICKSTGMTKALSVPFPDWWPEAALTLMNKMETETAIALISSPGIWFADGPIFSKNLARACNEYMAELRKSYSGRFGGFA